MEQTVDGSMQSITTKLCDGFQCLINGIMFLPPQAQCDGGAQGTLPGKALGETLSQEGPPTQQSTKGNGRQEIQRIMW